MASCTEMLNRAKQQCRGVHPHGVCYDAYIEEGVHIEYAGCSDTNYDPLKKQKEGWQVTCRATPQASYLQLITTRVGATLKTWSNIHQPNGYESCMLLVVTVYTPLLLQVYVGLPGLWELWSPGTRELTVSQHSSIFSMESHLVDFISAASEGLKAAPARTLVFGLTTAVCTDNMGPEGRLLSMFLHGQALEGSKHAEEIAWYNKGLKEVDEHPHAVMEARIERYRNHLSVAQGTTVAQCFPSAIFAVRGLVLFVTKACSRTMGSKTSIESPWGL